MSDSNDSKDLDKYGVWVKNTPKDIKAEKEEKPENAIDDIDLPTDDDMFNDIEFPMTAEDLDAPADANADALDIDIDIPTDSLEEPSAAEDENTDTTLSPDELSNITGEMEGAEDENADTTLSPDELLNITENQDIPTEDQAEEAVDGMDSFNLDDLDATASMEEPAVEEVSFDEPVADEAAVEEPAMEEPAIEEAATEEISLDDIPDGEVSLDDFMSDSSGGDSTPDGDVDLSAFMDGDDGEVDLGAFMDDAPAKKEAKPEEIQDEKSLDIDVSFDDSASEIEQVDIAEESAEPEPAPAPAAESDDMFENFGGKAASAPAKKENVSDANTEEIDLSDFGFDDDDSNIGMTNGPESAGAPKVEVVNYDMKVSADDDTKTPSVQDVVMGNVESSAETELDEGEAMNTENANDNTGKDSLEINEKGKEILEQIMGELSSLKDEIKNLKNDFADLKDRPTVAAGTAPVPAAETSAPKEENTGFFGADDDGDDTIALSGNELTNILSSAEFSTEDGATEEGASVEASFDQEPLVEDGMEPESDESSIGGEDITMSFNESDMEEPTIDSTEITPEDLAGTTDEFGEENVLPEEISVPKSGDDITVESSSSDLMDSVVNTDELQESAPTETINEEALDEIMQEDVSIADSLNDEKIDYMRQDVDNNDDIVSVDDIVKENVSLQEDTDDVSVSVGDDINSAFEEADALESEIADTALAEKDAYENSVSDIMKENISLQDDADNVSVSVGDDIQEAFKEADATESDIVDDALAEKDAYENSKSLEEEFNLDDSDNEEPVPETLDESVLAAPAATAESGDDEIDLSIFDEPAAEESADSAVETSEPTIADDNFEETTIAESSVEEPVVEEPLSADAGASAFAASAAETAVEDSASEKTSISKNLKSEIVSVLSYMDQLLENLPEDKITEFAKSEHFVTYKKLFDELGLS